MMPRRVKIVASELLGRPGTGGAGTADSLLAVALSRLGHEVELLIASGRTIGPLSDKWTRTYESAGVTIRVLDPPTGIEPSYLALPQEIFHALRERPPDVVVANDWRGLAYAALQARNVGLALAETAFVIHCHGPSRMLAEFAHKVPDRLARFGQEVAERASIELADAVVSPSAWLLDWMRTRGWPVPESASVIQYVRQSAALDEEPIRAPGGVAIRRLAFFGQLREGKGVRIYLAALEALEPEMLEGVELLFLGRETPRWTAAHISSSISSRVASVEVKSDLDHDAAIAELLEPGTLAVMPSLLDNSPNTVSECIEHAVPFVATRTGGIPELVAEEDRARVLCEPTVDDLMAALRRALGRDGFAPARPAREARDSLAAWLELIDSVSPASRREARRPTHVALVTSGGASAERAERLAQRTQSVEIEVITAESRRAGLAQSAASWVVFLDDDDIPDDAFVDTLVDAQAGSGADVVTAAVRPSDDDGRLLLFLGSPGALGLVENQYGVVGLLRGELAAAQPLTDGGVDPDWPLFARLALAGARIVSVPEPLSTLAGKPGHIADVPGEGLTVLAAFEELCAADVRDLPQLAATLGVAHARLAATPRTEPTARRTLAGVARRLLRIARSA